MTFLVIETPPTKLLIYYSCDFTSKASLSSSLLEEYHTNNSFFLSTRHSCLVFLCSSLSIPNPFFHSRTPTLWARQDNRSRWNKLLFDGAEGRYEIWENKFFGHLRSLGVKDAILGITFTGKDGDNERKEAYA